MPGTIHEVLLVAIMLLSASVVEAEKLSAAVMRYGLLSLAFVIVLIQLRAPDVALSAVVVGAIVTGLFLYTVKEVGE
ncbi:hydrogenase subunit MbhD domain-containing protein [Thermococcus stetteri]|uniref:hydrogenase subunit MbhD domain-containing protein n=1 Tax=Thermococcus stetteri TaxID=49900 RepID=UPI001AE85DF5|nr:hydrogenase subunit MbhD domain-containing protein [Thermococcus stetteri]MBP1912263.1 multicomponent Na+:H+ antiporter subunit A [Thermococcus stetteri]